MSGCVTSKLAGECMKLTWQWPALSQKSQGTFVWMDLRLGLTVTLHCRVDDAVVKSVPSSLRKESRAIKLEAGFNGWS